MFRTFEVLSVSFFLLLLSVIAYAQGGVATGDLRIRVKDPSDRRGCWLYPGRK